MVNPTPSRLRAACDDGKFVITCELSPPKGTDISTMVEKALMLKDSVDAINMTDSAAARMTLDPMVAGYELLKRGVEPILQITSRDKNRLALQSGMLGAQLLGIPNLVIMGGDPPHIGDHPEAKGVSDLFASEIVEAASALNSGKDHAGNELKGETGFYIGSVFNPGATDQDREIDNTQRKADAGAVYFQTQAIYQVEELTSFLKRLNRPNIIVLAGIIPVKSVKMATYMNERVPGIDIPDDLIKRIAAAEEAGNVVEESLSIASNTVKELDGLCQGIHIMAIGWEKHINDLIALSK